MSTTTKEEKPNELTPLEDRHGKHQEMLSDHQEAKHYKQIDHKIKQEARSCPPHTLK